jgi:hypothetical protein
MTRNQGVKKSLFYLAVILLGLFVAFKVWWTQDGTAFLGILAFFMVTFGCLLFSISFSRVCFGKNIDFDIYTFTDKESLAIFKKKNGHKVATKISTIISCFFIAFIVVIIVLFVKTLKVYEFKQLSEYGVRQKVMIKKIKFTGKGDDQAVFDFYFNGIKHSNSLTKKELIVGDSTEIIFSSQNIDILKWADDFNPK